jgi:hypothetical protein
MINNIPSIFIVGNLTFTFEDLQKLPAQVIDEIKIEIPTFFKNNNRGRKFIRFFGCSLTFLENVLDTTTGEVTTSTYNPLHTTVHSNLANLNNTTAAIDLNIKVNDKYSVQDFLNSSHTNFYSDYVSTANNYLNPKIYEIYTHTDNIIFKFINEYGKRQKVFEIKRAVLNPSYSSVDSLIYSFQCLYKIEMELILEQN